MGFGEPPAERVSGERSVDPNVEHGMLSVPSPCGSGTVFAKEAVDQLTYNLTADVYKGRVVVVLAGYPEEMDEMFKSVNPGFASRFRQRIHFPDWDAVGCGRF